MPNKIISKRSGAPVFHFSQKDLQIQCQVTLKLFEQNMVYRLLVLQQYIKLFSSNLSHVRESLQRGGRTSLCSRFLTMELAHSLLLNEDALAQITEAKRPVFIFEWLRFLDKVLVAANKVTIQIFSFSESESLEAFCNSIVLFFLLF